MSGERQNRLWQAVFLITAQSLSGNKNSASPITSRPTHTVFGGKRSTTYRSEKRRRERK